VGSFITGVRGVTSPNILERFAYFPQFLPPDRNLYNITTRNDAEQIFTVN